MPSTEEFNSLVAQTIMECQRIEHDVKMIYAAMLKGDFAENLSELKDKALGQVLIELEELDNSDGHPYLFADDYKLLNEIRTVRNWLVHKSYIDFMYDSGTARSRNFDRSFNKLYDFNKRLNRLGDEIENVRLDCLKRFGRI